MMITTRFNLCTMVPPAAAGDFTVTSFLSDDRLSRRYELV